MMRVLAETRHLGTIELTVYSRLSVTARVRAGVCLVDARRTPCALVVVDARGRRVLDLEGRPCAEPDGSP